jgi:hypothetical protein
MKSIFFILFYLSIFVLPVFSQDVISDNKQWNIAVGVYNGVDITYTTSAFRFNGDSLLDNIRYAKLYESDNEDLTDWKLYAFMREEGGKLIRRDLFAIDENVVADFNIQPADTFVTEENYKLVVESVTHEEWGGKIRKIITLHSSESPNDSFLWIEGVGNNRLFARSGDILPGGWSYTLLCFTENGELLYQNPYYNSCEIRTSLTNIEKQYNLIEIVPDNMGKIQLNLLESRYGKISIYNSIGKCIVYEKEITRNTQIKTNVTGLHIFRFVNEIGQTQTGKVMVR